MVALGAAVLMWSPKAKSAIGRRIKPLLISLVAVVLTTAVLLIIDWKLQSQHLVVGYLLPVAMIAARYGSMFAFFAAAVSGVAAEYFLVEPKYSFRIDEPLHAVELGMFMMLALIAAKIIALLMHDRP